MASLCAESSPTVFWISSALSKGSSTLSCSLAKELFALPRTLLSGAEVERRWALGGLPGVPQLSWSSESALPRRARADSGVGVFLALLLLLLLLLLGVARVAGEAGWRTRDGGEI